MGRLDQFFSTKTEVTENTAEAPAQWNETIDKGDLHFTAQEGGNTSEITYQEADGAPVEAISPLGYNVGGLTIAMLNASMIIGTGIFSTPGAIFVEVGSVGLSFIYWTLGFFISISVLSVYLEFASYFPSRSGGEVVYLEQAYLRPKYFFPTVFAIQNVIFSFGSGNAIVLAQYLLRLGGHAGTDWQIKGVAIAGYTLAILQLLLSTRWSLRINNVIGIIKLITLIFIGITGLVVLGGGTDVPNPRANFQNAFAGSSSITAYGATHALYYIIFSYSGYTNAFNVVNEVQNPIKALKRNTSASLLFVTVLYLLANVAYFAAATKEEIATSGQTTASILFEKVFKGGRASRALNFLIALSAYGNLCSYTLGQSRMIRECGRQGVLPFTRYWTSTWPFGTPAGPYFVQWLLTLIMILAPPAGDAFNFIVDLNTYPSAVFLFVLVIGLLITRWRRKRLDVPKPDFRAWNIAVYFAILVQLYTLVMPWYPPLGGADGGDVSFWYGTYIVVGLSILALCGIYYITFVKILPRVGKYELRQTVLDVGSGGISHQLVKVPIGEIAKWDAEHDALGRVNQGAASVGETEKSV